jgi:PleD family two-component response regulator
MGIRDYFRRRQVDTKNCGACGAVLPGGANYCSNCGVRLDEPEAQPLHIVDRATGLFNDRFIRPVLEDELARAHRYGRPLGIVLVENVSNGDGAYPPEALPQQEETLKLMAAAVAGTLRDVDTPGVLGRRPPSLLVVLPDTDIAGTAHAATRVLDSVNTALSANGRRAALGIVCVHHGQRLRAGAVIEAASRSLRSGRPELLGR